MVVVGRERLAVLCAGSAVGFACLALGVSFDQMAWSCLFVVCSVFGGGVAPRFKQTKIYDAIETAMRSVTSG
jgi:hypothetical protein